MNDENNIVVCIISQIIAQKPISSQGAVDGEGSQIEYIFYAENTGKVCNIWRRVLFNFEMLLIQFHENQD